MLYEEPLRFRLRSRAVRNDPHCFDVRHYCAPDLLRFQRLLALNRRLYALVGGVLFDVDLFTVAEVSSVEQGLGLSGARLCAAPAGTPGQGAAVALAVPVVTNNFELFALRDDGPLPHDRSRTACALRQLRLQVNGAPVCPNEAWLHCFAGRAVCLALCGETACVLELAREARVLWAANGAAEVLFCAGALCAIAQGDVHVLVDMSAAPIAIYQRQMQPFAPRPRLRRGALGLQECDPAYVR